MEPFCRIVVIGSWFGGNLTYKPTTPLKKAGQLAIKRIVVYGQTRVCFRQNYPQL